MVEANIEAYECGRLHRQSRFDDHCGKTQSFQTCRHSIAECVATGYCLSVDKNKEVVTRRLWREVGRQKVDLTAEKKCVSRRKYHTHDVVEERFASHKWSSML